MVDIQKQTLTDLQIPSRIMINKKEKTYEKLR